ncbi:MAG: helix-turn-helix domain-containing protein [Tepidisphaeraceae bacterium]|jgi:DNA-binding transcriptional ArsR family regulator
MSTKRLETMARSSRKSPRHFAPVFFALGDPTRLALLTKLSQRSPSSIAALTEGSALTRQAITKHLRVLQNVGLIRGVRHGRENLFELERHSLDEARLALDRISQQWDVAIARLKSFVEE